jgi:GH25 family lysozyme M1 (1,4-beta-N-acetylmuramidase)
MLYTIFMCDISNHNPGFDVGRAVSEGYSAIIMKASQGTWYEDPLFDGFATKTLAAGAIPGAYHWLENSSGTSQANLFHQRISAHGGPKGWLCACDCEANADWETLTDFFQRWKELTDSHPLIMYSGDWWWKIRGWDATSLTPYLWDSRYVSDSGYGSALYEQVPESWWTPRYGGWSETTILQFSDQATVAGMRVDIDAFRGTKQELLKVAGVKGETGMEQTDTMIKGPAQWRLLGDHFADLQELRNWLVGESVPASYAPNDASPLHMMLTAAALTITGGQVTLTDDQVQALADKVAPLVAERVAATTGESLSRLISAIAAAGNDLAQLGDKPSTHHD